MFALCLFDTSGQLRGMVLGATALLFALGPLSYALYRSRLRCQRFESALQHMAQGLALYDRRQRLQFCNDRFAAMFGLDPAHLRPGTTLDRVLDARIAVGAYPGTDPEAFRRDRLAVVADRLPSRTIMEFADGRMIAADHQPTMNGGWVVTFEDVTTFVQTQGELALTRVSLSQARTETERAAQDAHIAHERLREAFDAVPEGLLLLDSEDRCLLWNRRYGDLFARRTDKLVVGMSFEEMLRSGLRSGEYPDAIGREEAWLAARLERHRQPHSSYEQAMPDGRWMRVEERRTAEGGSIGVRIDITDLKQREASLKLLFESNPIPMWVHDCETMRFLAVNEAAVEHFGFAHDRFLEMSITDIVADWTPAEDLGGPGTPIEALQGNIRGGVRSDGVALEMAIYSHALRFGGRAAAMVGAVDMTERRRAEARIAYLAHHDPLTGLPNRTAFTEKLDDAIQVARADNTPFAVLCVDLDQFKDANDVFGHAVGDQLLTLVSRRLRSAVGECFLARIGGDEFTLISCSREHPAHAAALAEAMIASVAEPFDIQGQRLRIGLSVGVAVFPRDGDDATSIVANADAALYRAKANGRLAAQFFEPDMDMRLREAHVLQHDLRMAIVRGQLAVHYQPQVRDDGRVFGFEALLRWHHPERGMISPDIFIGLAERNGTINEIGEWVLRQACRAAASWEIPLTIAVNLSPVQFRNDQMLMAVASILESTGLDPRRLELEITEGVLIKDRVRALSVLRGLKHIGVNIALDDFGTGYSSLSTLKSFPFDKIKIDRTFLSGVDSNEQSVEIVRAVIGLGHALGMPVIAEGVECQEQRDFLIREGCKEMQGYLFGAPAPIEAYGFMTGNAVEMVSAA